LRETRKLENDTSAVTIAAADPANLVGIIVPGDRPAATAGRTVQFRGGHFVSEINPAPEQITAPLPAFTASQSPAQLALGHD
jgi:ATP-dependent helicase Lhr and Lhr-like helicase